MPGNYNAVGGFGFNPYDPRPDPRPEPGDGRPVLQTGGSSSGIGTAANFWAGNVGIRYRRIDHQPVERQHAGRHPPHHWTHQPIRGDSNHRGSRYRRADDAHGRRCGDHAGRHGRGHPGPERRRHANLHAAAQSRLHQVPQRRRIEGRAHRRAAGVLYRSRDAARREGAAWRPEPGAGQGHGRRHCRAQAARGDRGRSGGPAQLCRNRRRRQLSVVRLLLRRRARQGQGQPMLRRRSSTA